MNLALTLLIIGIFIILVAVGLGATVYFTTVYTLRAWHCYKNIKIDPINATNQKDTSVSAKLKRDENYQKILEMG